METEPKKKILPPGYPSPEALLNALVIIVLGTLAGLIGHSDMLPVVKTSSLLLIGVILGRGGWHKILWKD